MKNRGHTPSFWLSIFPEIISEIEDMHKKFKRLRRCVVRRDGGDALGAIGGALAGDAGMGAAIGAAVLIRNSVQPDQFSHLNPEGPIRSA